MLSVQNAILNKASLYFIFIILKKASLSLSFTKLLRMEY